MNLPRFFCPVPLRVGSRLPLPPSCAHHAVRVLRLQAGAAIVLFDGRGGSYEARIETVERGEVTVAIGAWNAQESEASLPIRLIQALQAADKMDYTIQKAVELGVTAICPVSSQRSVVRLDSQRAAKRIAHWRDIAVAACEQCGRNRLPVIDEIVPLDRWLTQSARTVTPAQRLLLDPAATTVLGSLATPVAVDILVGAEGGFDPVETDHARRGGFIPVRLGPRILRTETAALAALAAIQTLWGDFKR